MPADCDSAAEAAMNRTVIVPVEPPGARRDDFLGSMTGPITFAVLPTIHITRQL